MKGSVPGGAPLWVARLGPEGSLRSAVPTATPFASAQAVAVSDGGNVFGWAARSKEGPTEIVRIAPDGAESSLLPIDAAYNWGTRGFDSRTGQLASGLARKGEGPTQRMLVLAEQGALRRTLEVQSTMDSHIGAVAIGSDGSLILAVGTWAPARVVGASTPIELASPPPGGATWLIALDARGAPSWSRALTADGRITVSAIEVDPDGTLFVTGESLVLQSNRPVLMWRGYRRPGFHRVNPRRKASARLRRACKPELSSMRRSRSIGCRRGIGARSRDKGGFHATWRPENLHGRDQFRVR